MNRWFAPLGLSLGLLLVGTLWLRGQGTAVPEGHKDKEERFITTTGTAKLRVKADSARVFGSVEKIAPTVKEAREESNAAVNKLTLALKALKIDGLKMKTADVSIHPQLDDSKEAAPHKIVGYRVTYDFTVLIENTDSERLNAHAGKVLDAILENGANKLDRVVFFKKDESAAQREAKTKAVEDALVNAKALLAGAQVAKFQVTQIYDSPGYTPWVAPALGNAQLQNPFNPAQAVPQPNDETRVMAGEVEVSCTVTVVCSY